MTNGDVIKTAIGWLLLGGAIVCLGLIAANDHTRRLGGHDLRPLWLPACLSFVGGLGLVVQRAWAQIISSSLIASLGIWVIVHRIILRPIASDAIFTFLIGAALLIPAYLTFRKRRYAPFTRST